jgi:nicotinate-nucleotide adenylyltransferase
MRLGVLGGTFDPIHNGHVAAADAAQGGLGLERMLLVPSRLPPHRPETPRAGAADRLAMAALAAAERPGWSASDIEIAREGPSYTFDTLTALGQQGHAASQIFCILGADAFAEIATWSRYPSVLDLANFVVVARPGITLDSVEERWPEPREHTRIILIHTTTPDVSSTEIRRRVRAGESIAGLVPDPVASYISEHRLYVEAGL